MYVNVWVELHSVSGVEHPWATGQIAGSVFEAVCFVPP